MRVATTLKKEDGTSAIGTALDANSPAVAKLNKGEAFYGDATIFGKPTTRDMSRSRTHPVSLGLTSSAIQSDFR